MKYTVRPLSDRTWTRPAGTRIASRFDSTWTSTRDLLGREIDQLHGRDIVIEVDVEERHIRLDGMLRSDAKAASPAVVVAFETTAHGPMLYRCDRYTRGWRSSGTDWQENVRAIALTLQALRAVDRYGATETGQQYAGFKALPAGRAMPASHMTYDHAFAVAAAIAYPDDDRSQQDAIASNRDTDTIRVVVRRAKANAHPDRRGGDHALWNTLAPALSSIGAS
jgi:D-tyrosyl-tRNA(Tyr) deacylase